MSNRVHAGSQQNAARAGLWVRVGAGLWVRVGNDDGQGKRVIPSPKPTALVRGSAGEHRGDTAVRRGTEPARCGTRRTFSRSIHAAVTPDNRECHADMCILPTMTNAVRATRESPAVSLRGDVIVSNRGLLRVEEAAKWLGVGRTKTYALVHNGTLPSVTIGRSRRIAVSALEAFVEQLVDDGSVS